MAVFTKKSPHANHTVPKPVVANPTKPKIAIIGSGVSGLTCAYCGFAYWHPSSTQKTAGLGKLELRDR